MRYENKKQIVKFLLKSSLVIFDTKREVIQFIGLELERCELKVPTQAFTEIFVACKALEINLDVI